MDYENMWKNLKEEICHVPTYCLMERIEQQENDRCLEEEAEDKLNKCYRCKHFKEYGNPFRDVDSAYSYCEKEKSVIERGFGLTPGVGIYQPFWCPGFEQQDEEKIKWMYRE